MFGIAVFFKGNDGSKQLYQGTLVRLPPELAGAGRLARYSQVVTSGWSRDDLGYDQYSRFDFNGNLIIVPGIITPDNKTAKRIHGYDPRYSKSQIEAFVEGIIEAEKVAFERAAENLNMLIHDLRNISGSIVNAAVEAETQINRGNYHEAGVRIENIKAAQSILKIRTDVLDFLGNPASVLTVKEIQPYPKVDKVCRIFKPRANARDIRIDFSGRSHLVVQGPEILEIVPYVLIDNAIKYSPPDSVITVNVEDQEDGAVQIECLSLGPKILPHEQLSVFEKNVRGLNAQEWAIPGSGLGLFLLKQIVTQHFGGEVAVLQEPTFAREVDGKEYFFTTFFVRLPEAQKKSKGQEERAAWVSPSQWMNFRRNRH